MCDEEQADQEDAVAAAKPADYKLLWGCLAVTVLLVLFYLGFYLSYIRAEGKVQVMSRAKSTLRSIGYAQIAYFRWNDRRVYGSFQALQDIGDIPDDYTPDNMVDFYTLTWEVNNISTAPTEAFPTGVMSSFTIIAYPTDMSIGNLATFAITDDQVVGVYDPRKCVLDDVRTWDPIL